MKRRLRKNHEYSYIHICSYVWFRSDRYQASRKRRWSYLINQTFLGNLYLCAGGKRFSFEYILFNSFIMIIIPCYICIMMLLNNNCNENENQICRASETRKKQAIWFWRQQQFSFSKKKASPHFTFCLLPYIFSSSGKFPLWNGNAQNGTNITQANDKVSWLDSTWLDAASKSLDQIERWISCQDWHGMNIYRHTLYMLLHIQSQAYQLLPWTQNKCWINKNNS